MQENARKSTTKRRQSDTKHIQTRGILKHVLRAMKTLPLPQLSGSHRENRATPRATFNSAYHRSQTAICELSYDMTNFMTASSFLM